MMSTNELPKVLFIDAYDSFSNNIIDLLETELQVNVVVIKIDAIIDDFSAFVRSFSAVIAGPGPGHPARTNDVGLIGELWKLQADDIIPVLGICLGFQSLVHAFGGSVEPLPEARHGIPRIIRSCGKSIFRDHKKVHSIQYHSLHANLRHPANSSQDPESGFQGLWQPSEAVPELIPLAWDFADDNHESMRNNPYAILMAVMHTAKPFYGIQFHSESICSSASARAIISNWWQEAKTWTSYGGRSLEAGLVHKSQLNMRTVKSYKSNIHQSVVSSGREPLIDDSVSQSCDISECATILPNDSMLLTPPATPKEVQQVISAVVPANDLTVPGVCQLLDLTKNELIVLDSEMHQRDEVGIHSIIGIVSPESVKLEYYIKTNRVIQRSGETKSFVDLNSFPGSVFDYLKVFMAQYEAAGGNGAIPFWGGLIGYITYEACLETINITTKSAPYANERPDLSFVLIERSLVMSHREKIITIQSIRENDTAWVYSTANSLKSLTSPKPIDNIPSLSSEIRYPSSNTYKSAIRSCQAEIRKGNAYELCLTNQSHIRSNTAHLSPWHLHLRLRRFNAAPFSAYVRLGPLTLLSSSPERFLRWSRPERSSFDPDREIVKCQFRPIKGTVKKSRAQTGLPDVSLSEATAILSTPKERAENLMIVDLIRHDLHGVVGSGRVTVPKLMVVEEYETVFQLVTVIEGDLLLENSANQSRKRRSCLDHKEDLNIYGETLHKRAHVQSRSESKLGDSAPAKSTNDSNNKGLKSGIDVLASSLPPGSMTGAPKRRACQILQSLENREPRGIYSGVVGYLDAGGGGDFSVVIRSAVKWDKSNNQCGTTVKGGIGDDTDSGLKDSNLSQRSEHSDPMTLGENTEEQWTIGAGGAVTSLSTEDGEWEEMLTKLNSTLRLFTHRE